LPPLTFICQLPWLPVTLTTLGPAGMAGSVMAAGAVPVILATVTESMFSEAPETVAAVGVVTPAMALGSEPPMLRLKLR